MQLEHILYVTKLLSDCLNYRLDTSHSILFLLVLLFGIWFIHNVFVSSATTTTSHFCLCSLLHLVGLKRDRKVLQVQTILACTNSEYYGKGEHFEYVHIIADVSAF